jgi:bifunctional DNA-binding transcriptional regulator/antitoxin component of YhaV-PrlF toxin-antitoxin module
LVIPKSVRDAHGWAEGMEFEFVEGEGGVTLQPVQEVDPRFPAITMKELLSRSVKIKRFPTDEEIEKSVLEEAARRFHAEIRR